MAVPTPRALFARGAAIALLLGAGLVAVAPPASAAESGTLSLRAACPNQGEYCSGVYLIEDFSGLVTVSPYPSYSVGATHQHDTYTDTISDSSWYPDSDGTHAVEQYEFATDAVGPTPQVKPGDSYHWKLVRTYGGQTVVLEGDTVVQPPTGCASPPPPPTGTPPAAASFGSSPHKVKVNHKGRFHYSFRGTTGLHGTIVVKHNGTTWAGGSFVIPSGGTETIALRVTKKARKYLAAHHRAKTAVTVVLTNSYGSRSAGTTLRLRWA
jgi:hypothetical protein